MPEPKTNLDQLMRDPKAAKLLKQKDLLKNLMQSPDTQRLMLHLAGNPGTKLRRIAVRRMLKNYWEITDHDTAVEEMSELLTMGMRMQFHVMMEIQEQRAVLGADSGPDRSQRGGEKDLPVPEESGLQARLLSAWRRQGPNALLGWEETQE